MTKYLFSVRGGTLPRQPSNHMQGRPLPPPPPSSSKPLSGMHSVNTQREYFRFDNLFFAEATPPPILPKKSASLAQMSGLAAPGGRTVAGGRAAPRSIPMPGSSSAPRDQWGGTGGSAAASRDQWTSSTLNVSIAITLTVYVSCKYMIMGIYRGKKKDS